MFKHVYIIFKVTMVFIVLFGCFSVSAKDKSGRITSIILKNERALTKMLSTGEECGYPGDACQKNILTYYKETPEGGYDMIKINTENMVKAYGLAPQKSAMREFKPFIKMKQSSSKKDKFPVLARLFDDCLDYRCPIIMDLGQISYPGMQKARLVCTMDTQNDIGDLVVRIYAYKNNNFVQISGDSNINTNKYMGICRKYTDDQLAACFIEKVKADGLLQIKIKNRAGQLLQLFATPEERKREPNGIYIRK